MLRRLAVLLATALLGCATTVPGAVQNAEGEAIGSAEVELTPSADNNSQRVVATMPDGEIYQGNLAMIRRTSIDPEVHVSVHASNTEKTKTQSDFGLHATKRIVGAQGRLVSNRGNSMDCQVHYAGGTKGLFDSFLDSGHEEGPAGALCIGNDGRRLLFSPPDPNHEPVTLPQPPSTKR